MMNGNDANNSDEYEEFLYVPLKPNPMYTAWGTKGKNRRAAIKLRWIDNFNARGMQFVYGRNDCSSIRFGRGRHSMTFTLGMWRTRDGRVFARFSSRSKDISTQSMELVGMKLDHVLGNPWEEDHEALVPQILRDAYAYWQLNELEDAGLW